MQKACRQCVENHNASDDLLEEHGPVTAADVPAHFYVTGSVENGNSRSGRRPYRAYLCDGHAEILLQDEGEEFFRLTELE